MRAATPRHLAGATVAIAAAIVLAILWSGGTAPVPEAPPIVIRTAHEARLDTLHRNETLSHLFARHNIDGRELYELLAAADGLEPRRVRAGQVFQFRYAVNEAAPDRVIARLGDAQVLTLVRDTQAGWHGYAEPIAWTVHLERVTGTISSSLFETLDAAIPDSLLDFEERARLAWDLADGIFGWVIDFNRDVYEGDQFQLLYERLISPMGDRRFGRVVAARVETRGTLNSAYVLDGEDGRNVYYDETGESLRRAFKLSPVPYRVTSRFSRRRYHPILKTYRPHLGVDFGAPFGAEIRATADGTIIRTGRWGGYGLMVGIRHVNGIETRYAHMSRLERGIAAGVRVRQGERIGFVGSTGLATAPHVHYEFLKNGKHVDPRYGLEIGDGDPVPEVRRADFESVRADYDRLFEWRPAPPVVSAGVD
jgi:murein DD-endopeptidase MepM/ murein hydrolase activator NlpD